MKNVNRYILTACVLLFCAKAVAQTDSTINYKDSVKGQRYCEIVLVKVSIPNVNVDVFNTLGYSACPEELWKNVNTDGLKKQFSVHTVVANGPRYYLMDKIGLYNGDTTTVTFDSLQMRESAKIRMSIGKAMSLQKNEPYKDKPFKLATAKFFNKGDSVYELVSPEHTYVMESYSIEVDSSLTEATLPALGQRLKLPDGWQYKIVVLDADLQLITTSDKEAFGIEDELWNRYQRVD